MTKRATRIRVPEGMTQQQREALAKVQADMQKAMPQMTEMARAAQGAFKSLVDAPNWSMSEVPRPQQVSQPKPWNVGHAKVNYVDKIELRTEGTEEE